MDTLISVGTLAALGWSLYTLVLGDAGVPGMRHGFCSRRSEAWATARSTSEVAAGVTTFILAGRYFEARATLTASSRPGPRAPRAGVDSRHGPRPHHCDGQRAYVGLGKLQELIGLSAGITSGFLMVVPAAIVAHIVLRSHTEAARD